MIPEFNPRRVEPFPQTKRQELLGAIELFFLTGRELGFKRAFQVVKLFWEKTSAKHLTINGEKID